MQKFFSTVLFSIILLTSLFASSATATSTNDTGSLDHFIQVNAYLDNQFTDVSSAAWYYQNVKTAYELGLVNGNSDTTFNPTGNISIAETITLASRLHSIYYANDTIFEQGSPWYQVYVDYAIDNKIILADQFSNFTKLATRAEFAAVLANSLPDTALPFCNDIHFIHDVPFDKTYTDAVYTLYNAGILTGSDDFGTFNATTPITRAEVATIITRMAIQSQRQEFSIPNVLLTTDKTNITISEETVINISASSDGPFDVFLASSHNIIKLSADEFIDDTTFPLTISPLKNGTEIIELYVDRYPDCKLSITVTVTGCDESASDTLQGQKTMEASAYDVIISDKTEIVVSCYVQGARLHMHNDNTSVVAVNWGDWIDDSRIPIIIEPLSNGTATLTVTNDKNTDSITITVAVSGFDEENTEWANIEHEGYSIAYESNIVDPEVYHKCALMAAKHKLKYPAMAKEAPEKTVMVYRSDSNPANIVVSGYWLGCNSFGVYDYVHFLVTFYNGDVTDYTCYVY